jgi:hypothetical protein
MTWQTKAFFIGILLATASAMAAIAFGAGNHSTPKRVGAGVGAAITILMIGGVFKL